MIALAVFTDGRHDCLARTLASADRYLHGPITERHLFNDSPSPSDRRDLDERYGDVFSIHHTPKRRGFGGSIRYAWSVLSHDPHGFVFHLEDDFVFERPADLRVMAAALDRLPNLAQLALRRQPWNAEERAAGGVVEQYPDDYREVWFGLDAWLEHRRFFTTNPSLYRRSLCRHGWPDVEHSEGVFSLRLLADPDVRCGFWGSRDSGEWVTHIGEDRVGAGY